MSLFSTIYFAIPCSNCQLTKLKRKCFEWICFFLLGAVISCIITILVLHLMDRYNFSGSSQHPAWNSSHYLSNSEFYKKMDDIHDFTQMDNLRLDRLFSPRFHPTNGKSIIYLRRQHCMPNFNKSSTTLHWFNLETNKTVQLTQPLWGIHDQQFYWVNDKAVLFLSNRASTGLTQLFQLNLPDNLSAITNFLTPIQITNYPLNIDNLLVNKQGTRLAFSCHVFANLTIEETAKRQAAEQASDGLVYKFDKLFIRQWNEYILGRRHHPFVVSIKKNIKGIYYFTSIPRDVLFGIDSDSPSRTLGDDQSQWSFSASGNKFAFSRRYGETSEVAWSTNSDIFTVDLTVSESIPVCITINNPAIDGSPRYSPTEENLLVYVAQSVPGYAADQYKIKIYNGSTTKTLLDDWDRSIQAITWSQDSRSLFLEIGEEARNVIYKFSNIFSPLSIPNCLINTGYSQAVNIHPTNNDIFVYIHESIIEPPNIYLYSSSTSMRPLTDHNKALMDKVRISKIVETFNFTGSQNETVWGWHIAPVNGTSQKAPLAFLIHGGPQSSWYDAWTESSNFQTFSSQGYAVIAINFHGSVSYGQKFTDSIRNNYGSLPYEDLQLGLTAALQRYSYIDGNRAVALGRSYGGYMVNWIAGHPEMSHRFKALVSEAGIYDLRSLYYSLDELSILEYCMDGFTPYENLDAYEKFNPVNHVANWSQPMLIVHGARDYRVPDTQGIGAFIALQRRNITSRLVYFPKEHHGTSDPANTLKWHEEVLGWMAKWIVQ